MVFHVFLMSNHRSLSSAPNVTPADLVTREGAIREPTGGKFRESKGSERAGGQL